MLEKLRRLRARHLLAIHNLEFYPYQEAISDRILEALVQNLRLTADATEEDIKQLKLVEIPIEISRQAGKTSAIVHTVEFIMIYFPKMFELKKRLEIGIFAPMIEQAKTDFDRLKEALMRSMQLYQLSEAGNQYKEENNSRTIVLPNGSTCYIAPISKTSLPESKSLALIIFEENQDADDQIVKERIWPMGATTNAPRIYVGTAGTRICHFYRMGQLGLALKIYFDEIIKQRRILYEKSGDARHLIYEQTVRQEIEKNGRESDEIQRPYYGKWLIGTGQFTTEQNLNRLYDDKSINPQATYERGITWNYTKTEAFVGIDTAKHPDSTVVTVLRDNAERAKKELIAWLELQGENYQNQFEMILDFLKQYQVAAIAIDSTSQGAYMPDMFERNTQWQDENTGLYRVVFSAPMKSRLYENLKVSINEFLTTLPKIDKKNGERFRQQMLDLQQEYKGQLLSVHHPDGGHDDYCDSLALAEWAYAKWKETNPQINVVNITREKERHRENSGQIDAGWPSSFR